jgi:ribonuclease Z
VALAKRHSMTGEAVEIGARARAFRTILTHFSQRYPKIPAIGASFTASTCIAFDLLSVNLAGARAATLAQAHVRSHPLFHRNLGPSVRVC